MMDIINYVKNSETIASSGQPKLEDFVAIAAQGYTIIINLALASSDNAIPNEGDIVTEMGLSYVHIPVQWQNPTYEQFQLFVGVMQQQQEQKIWVHCAKNMRVSAFIYLYNTLYLDMPDDDALAFVYQVWQPNETWSTFITTVKAKHQAQHQ